MGRTPVCIDANIVVRFVADPADRAVAALWRRWEHQGIAPAAPSLIFYEVTNALYRYEKAKWMSFRAAEEALRAASALPIETIDESRLYQAAMRVSRRYDLPAAYNGHYLAVAQSLDADLWTTDRRLFNSVKNSFPKIHLAED